MTLVLLVAGTLDVGAPARAQTYKDDAVVADLAEVRRLSEERKYAAALARQRTVAKKVEKAERRKTGKPGEKTAEALADVAWQGLLARKYAAALAASESANKLAPMLLAAQRNRAHSLLFLERIDEARDIYVAHRGKPVSSGDLLWEDMVEVDFAALREAGLMHPEIDPILTSFGLDLKITREAVTGLRDQTQRLVETGKLDDAMSAAERYVRAARRRYGEERLPFATALSWLARAQYARGRYAHAEPRAVRALQIAEAVLGPDHATVGFYLNDLGTLYREQGRYALAEPLLVRALAISEKLGPDHPEVGVQLSNLASLYSAQGRYAAAEPLHRRALAIAEKLGPDHPEVGRRLNNLASFYTAQGRYGDAETLLQKAVTIGEKTLGPSHVELGGRLNNLASLHQSMGEFSKADPLYLRALKIMEDALGSQHPNVGLQLNNVGEFFRAQGRLSEAEPLLRRALAIAEKAGRDSDQVGTVLNNLAGLYVDWGRYAEAEPLHQRALSIVEKWRGPDHFEVAMQLSNLASLYKDQGRYAEAEQVYDRALAIAAKSNPDHPDVSVLHNNLATLYRAQDRYAEAEKQFEKALAIVKALGPDHPAVAVQYGNLALLYQDQGRYSDAERHYQSAMSIAEKALGQDHSRVATIVNNLATLYRLQGRDVEAEPLVRRGLSIAEKRGGEHPLVGVALNNLADLYLNLGRHAEAEQAYARSLAIAEKLGANHPDISSRLSNLAALYRTQGRYAEAEAHYRRAVRIAETLGPNHTQVGLLLNNLAQLYEDQGRHAEAEPLMQRALASTETTLGPDHPDTAAQLNNIAFFHFVQGHWEQALKFWRRSTAIVVRRNLLGTSDVGRALTGKRRDETDLRSYHFEGLLRASYRVAQQGGGTDKDLAREAFLAAQRMRGSEAAASLAQMAARSARGNPDLAALVRERQDLVADWQRRDAARTAAFAKAPNQRDLVAEASNVARLRDIDTRIASIDARLAAEFPDYASLTRPEPLTLEEVQAELAPDEALMFAVETSDWKGTPEETFLWIISKTEVRWIRSELGSVGLVEAVEALRCGLDAALWDGDETAERCMELGLPIPTRDAHGNIVDGRLPFDLARAEGLYRALFGEVEDLVRGKHLLIVPSGPLAQLPLQVLVGRLPEGASSGLQERQGARLGAELSDLSAELRQEHVYGVHVVRPLPGSPAERAGLKADDILQSVGGNEVRSMSQAVRIVRQQVPGYEVMIRIRRDGRETELAVNLEAAPYQEWVPHLLQPDQERSVQWLVRSHALTVLPAVSTLRSLRRVAKASAATRPMLGIGNPLLDGDPASRPWEAQWAAQARQKQVCKERIQIPRVAASIRSPRAAGARRGSTFADLEHLRSQAPLPDTADELCAAAIALKLAPEDLKLGEDATETTVKRMSSEGTLASYRVVHFATHGTMAGEIEGTTEPGLILTPPDKQTESDDGFLSASEVAALKLDADWVILSACNTAAGGTKTAQSLSGLARAFFYAGARGLLVSHWAVASASTERLITSGVRTIISDAKLGRAEAFRRAMLTMIDSGEPYESHPAFWAPFVVVGGGTLSN